MAEQLGEASGWKVLVEASGQAGGQTDRHKTRADRQTGRQQPEVNTCSVGRRGLDAL